MNYKDECNSLSHIIALCNGGELTDELFDALRESEYLFLHFPECNVFLRERKCPKGFLKRVSMEARYFSNLLKGLSKENAD